MKPSVSQQKIDSVLPQTQCGLCQHDGCMPYAKSIKDGTDSIDKCAPGGLETLKSLSLLTGIDETSYIEHVKDNTISPSVAYIVESECIGCTKCIQACPVDAIIGQAKLMHTIIEDRCTGCNLCIPACPVDCIESTPLDEYRFDKNIARESTIKRTKRLEKLKNQKIKRRQSINKSPSFSASKDDKKSYLQNLLNKKKITVNE